MTAERLVGLLAGLHEQLGLAVAVAIEAVLDFELLVLPVALLSYTRLRAYWSTFHSCPHGYA